MELKLYDQTGAEVGVVDVPVDRLGTRVNKVLLGQAVLRFEANQRTGTAAAKRVGEVAGSGKKPHRQKHTGWARAGKKRAPHYRKGGTAHGPRVRDFSIPMPKKALKNALRAAILSKFLDGEVTLVSGITLPARKTREVVRVLRALRIEETCLLGLPEADPILLRSARNLPNLRARPVREFNPYEVLRQRRLLLTRKGLDVLMDHLDPPGRPPGGEAA